MLSLNMENYDDEKSQQERPSLPGIHDLFGDHLSRPVKRPSPFCFGELSSSLPTDSQTLENSPSFSVGPGSLISSSTNSPRSAWSQASSSRGNASGWPRQLPEIKEHRLARQQSLQLDRFLTLPPIIPTTSSASSSRRASTSYIPSSLRSIMSVDSPPRRSSEMVGRELAEYEATLKRRHTISSSSSKRIFQSAGHSPTDQSFSRSKPGDNTLLAATSHPSLRYGSEPTDYSAPSPPSTTSGDEGAAPAPGERRKLVPKYECHYCGKMFNRPSSLKIHHNTHTGEKPFACSFPGCGRSFSVMSNMRRHARTHGDVPANLGGRDDTGDVEMADVYLTPTSAQTIVPPTAIPHRHPRSHEGSISHSQSSSRSASPLRNSTLASGLDSHASSRRSSLGYIYGLRQEPYPRSRSNSRSSQSSFEV